MTEKDDATVVSVKEYLEKYFNSRIEGIEKAIELAERALSARLESMNEFREQMKDQTSTFITKAEHSYVVRDIENLKLSRATLEGKADQKSVNTLHLIAIVSFIISALSLVVTLIR